MRFWYLLGMLSKISDEHPRHFHKGVPLQGQADRTSKTLSVVVAYLLFFGVLVLQA